MLLVDTSVWVAHLRSGSSDLARALDDGEVLCHPHVAGELACGNLHNHAEVVALLADLPQAVHATHEEALERIERNRIHGKGLGWTDVHLLASALLTPVRLWTLDTALAREAKRCGAAWRAYEEVAAITPCARSAPAPRAGDRPRTSPRELARA